MPGAQIGPIRRRYAVGTGADVHVGFIKAGGVDLALGADWTPATGDVKVSKDGGAAANIGTLPVAVAMGNGALWKFVFTNAELTAKTIVVVIADSVTKAVQDQMFVVETYGDPSAQHPGEVITTNGIDADALTTASYTSIGTNVGGGVLDAFTASHTTAGTVGKAIIDASTSGASNAALLTALAIAVDALPLLAEMLTAFGDLVGTSPGGGGAGDLKLDVTASVSDNAYNGWIAVLIAGAGAVAAQVVEDYVGATRTCVMAASWPTPPDAATQYVLLRVSS